MTPCSPSTRKSALILRPSFGKSIRPLWLEISSAQRQRHSLARRIRYSSFPVNPPFSSYDSVFAWRIYPVVVVEDSFRRTSRTCSRKRDSWPHLPPSIRKSALILRPSLGKSIRPLWLEISSVQRQRHSLARGIRYSSFPVSPPFSSYDSVFAWRIYPVVVVEDSFRRTSKTSSRKRGS